MQPRNGLALLSAMHNTFTVSTSNNEARVIVPSQIIGVAEAAQILGLERSTLTRKIKRGAIAPLAKVRGVRGAYIFDGAEIEAMAQRAGR